MNLVLFYPHEVQSDGSIQLTGARAQAVLDQHDIRAVGVTLKAGVRDGRLGRAQVTALADASSEAFSVSFALTLSSEPPARSPIEVVVGYPRPQTVKKIIQVAVSFGIKALHIVPFDKSIKSYQSSKVWMPENLEAELLESLQQVCDTTAPDILRYRSLTDFIKSCNDRAFDFWKHAVVFDARGARALSQEVHTRCIVFGPEAGFSEQELALFTQHNVPLFALGDRMLRLEHAVCAGLQSLLQEIVS
jgi:RsmE family RNA methyltransferase